MKDERSKGYWCGNHERSTNTNRSSFLIILQIELSLSHFSNRTLYNWRVVIQVVPVQTSLVTVKLNPSIMSRPSLLGRSEASFSAASSSVHVLTPRPWLPLSSFTFLLDDACHLLLDSICPPSSPLQIDCHVLPYSSFTLIIINTCPRLVKFDCSVYISLFTSSAKMSILSSSNLIVV